MYRYFHLPVSLLKMNIERHTARERMRKLWLIIHTNTLKYYRQQVAVGSRSHGNQSESSSANALLKLSLFLRVFNKSSRDLTTGCRPPPLCLFPNRPIGLTPRPTYQNGSISGPDWERSRQMLLLKCIFGLWAHIANNFGLFVVNHKSNLSFTITSIR